MIVQITENRKVNGRWYLYPQQYDYVGQHIGVKSPTDPTGVLYYDILIDDVTYTIPADMAALIDKESANPDSRGMIQRWEAYATKDIAAPVTGGKTDVVKQAEIFLDLNIRKRKRNIDIDQQKLRELEILRSKRRSKG